MQALKLRGGWGSWNGGAHPRHQNPKDGKVNILKKKK